MHAHHNSKCGTNQTQAHPHHTKQCTFCTHFTFALTISTYIPIWALLLDPFTKKCRTSIYARTPQFQVWYQSNPGTSPQFKTMHFLHSFHIRTHHKHLYTDLGPFLDTLHKNVPDQQICTHPTIPSVVPIEPRHIPAIQNSVLFALVSHSHSP